MPIAKKIRGNPNAFSSRKVGGGDNGASAKLSLPTQVNEPPENFSDYILLIYGDKGVGKSSLFAQWPDSVTLMTEPRRRNLPILQIPDYNKKEQPLNWTRMRGYGDLLSKSTDFGHVTLDTVDRTYLLAFIDCCRRKNVKHPQEMPGYEGAQLWHQIKMEFEEFIYQLLESGKSVGFISHARWREVVTVSGDKYEQTTPTCTDACWTILKAITDFAFYFGYQAQQRAFVIRGNDRIWASCGTSEDHFLTPHNAKGGGGLPVESLLAGNSPKQAYQTLVDGYNNKRIGPIYKEFNTEEDEPTEVSLPTNLRKKKGK